MTPETQSDIASGGPISGPRRLGRMLMGFILGCMLPIAVMELVALASDIAPFKYQGF